MSSPTRNATSSAAVTPPPISHPLTSNATNADLIRRFARRSSSPIVVVMSSTMAAYPIAGPKLITRPPATIAETACTRP